MTNAAAVADTIESELAPLTAAVSHAWWELNVAATDENERRRVELETALSDFLSDGDRFAAIEAARAGADGPARRRLDLLQHAFLPQQIPADLRSRIIELEASVETRFSRHRGEIDGRRVDENEIRRILRESDDPGERRAAWEASKTVGAEVADDVRELARLRNRAAHTLGFRDWFALSVAMAEMDEDRLIATLDEADRATAEPFARWKAELDERLAARFRLPGGRPRAVALRRRVLPGGAGRRRSRHRPVPRERRPRRAVAADVRRHRARDARRPRAERPVPARGQVPARVLHRHRPRGRRPRARERRPGAAVDGHDAPRARSRHLRRRLRRLDCPGCCATRTSSSPRGSRS